MPLNLNDFLNELNITPDQVAPMMEALYAWPPKVTASETSAFYSGRLKEICSNVDKQKLASQLTMIVEREVAIFVHNQRLDREKYAEIFGAPSKGEVSHMENLAILKASMFTIFKTGNCCIRVSYAAFELYKLLGEKVTIGIQSSPERDQYTLMIRKKEKEAPWYVYDAITNPELLFPVAQYNSEILPLYQKVTNPARKYTLTLNAELCNKYQSVLPKLQAFFTERSQEINCARLMSDTDFARACGFGNIGFFDNSSEEYQKKTATVNQAIDLYKQTVATNCSAKIRHTSSRTL